MWAADPCLAMRVRTASAHAENRDAPGCAEVGLSWPLVSVELPARDVAASRAIMIRRTVARDPNNLHIPSSAI